ncbi:MAG: hypothetical protein K8R99_12340 [Actinomycetia bacterium]|nr:hypothetical protein [Actinomycetes bacterium]
MAVEFSVLTLSDDDDTLDDFLCNNEWPFHALRQLTSDDLAAIEFREAWGSDGGPRFDTLIYGILRGEWAATAQNPTI